MAFRNPNKWMSFIPFLFLLLLFVEVGNANVEKTIFLAPPSDTPQLTSLSAAVEQFSSLDTISPSTSSIRKHLNSSFPTPNSLLGSRSWIRLANLHPNQRYEVRICWLATQPTSFQLKTFTIPEILASSSTLSSLSSYSRSRRNVGAEEIPPSTSQSILPGTSTLLLAVDAAADYFTLSQTLMETVPPVIADIILDPYLMNIFPKSLISTAIYIVFTGLIAWLAWRFIQLRVQGIVFAHSDGQRDVLKSE